MSPSPSLLQAQMPRMSLDFEPPNHNRTRTRNLDLITTTTTTPHKHMGDPVPPDLEA